MRQRSNLIAQFDLLAHFDFFGNSLKRFALPFYFLVYTLKTYDPIIWVGRFLGLILANCNFILRIVCMHKSRIAVVSA